MAVYGSSPFTAYASQSFDAGYDKHKTPVASYASSPAVACLLPTCPPVALTQSALTAAAAHHASGQRRMLHMQPVLVFMLLACALSAAYVMRPEEEGTGNTHQAFSLLRRRDAQEQQKQHLRDTVKCRLMHRRDSQHGGLDATTICAEQSSDGNQQQLIIWSMHSVSQQAQDEDSSSYTYVHAAEGTEYGHRRRRVVHRKTLLHLVQVQ